MVENAVFGVSDVLFAMLLCAASIIVGSKKC